MSASTAAQRATAGCAVRSAPVSSARERGGDVEFDDPAAGSGGGEPGGASAGDAVEQQAACGVGDGEAPLGAALGGDDGAGVGGRNRAEAGDLAGVLAVAEQGGQRDPHLDPDALVVARGGDAGCLGSGKRGVGGCVVGGCVVGGCVVGGG